MQTIPIPPNSLSTRSGCNSGSRWAKREIMPGVAHRLDKGLNKRAENSYQPTRRVERISKTVQIAEAGATVSFPP
jgi:transposase-like protein